MPSCYGWGHITKTGLNVKIKETYFSEMEIKNDRKIIFLRRLKCDVISSKISNYTKLEGNAVCEPKLKSCY